MKYGRMVYFGEMYGDHFCVFDSLSEAQEGSHPEARGRGAHGPVFELTGKRWEERTETRTVWTEK